MSGQEREVPIEAVGAVVLYLQECRRAKIKPSESEIARVAVYAADTARAALAAREEPTGDDALCECGHTAHWHAAVTFERKTGKGARAVLQGAGVCEYDGDCDCEGFRVGLFSDTVICCDHGKVATAHCEMSGDGLVTLGELIESYSNPPVAAREDTERPDERLRGALNAVCRAYHDMAHTPSRSYDHCIEVMCANVRQLLRDTERPDSACTCLIKAPPGSFEHVPDCPAAEQEHEG